MVYLKSKYIGVIDLDKKKLFLVRQISPRSDRVRWKTWYLGISTINILHGFNFFLNDDLIFVPKSAAEMRDQLVTSQLVAQLVTSTGCTGYITGRAGYISWSRWLHQLVALVTSAGRAGYITGRTGYINWLHWLHNWLHSWLPLLNVDNTKVVHANMLWNVSKHQSRLFLRSGGIHSRIL